MQRDPLQQHLSDSARGARRGLLATLRALFSFTSVKFLLVLLVMGAFGATLFSFGVRGDATLGLTLRANPDLKDGLVGHWTFDGRDVVGTTASDVSGQGNDGTLTGGPTRTIGRIGQALSFDGSADYVATGNVSRTFGDFTFVGWFKTTAAGTIAINSLGDDDWTSTSMPVLILNYLADGNSSCGFRHTVGGTFFSVSTLADYNDGQWHQQVCKRSGDQLSVCVDGVCTTETEESNSVSFASDPYVIGRGWNGSADWSWYFPGSLDDARIYNRALSAEEIARLYGTTGPQVDKGDIRDGLMAYYTFEVNDMDQNVEDSSGQGNHARLISFAATTTVPGVIGQALEFDGVNDFIRLPDFTSSFGTEATFFAWVKKRSHNAVSVAKSGSWLLGDTENFGYHYAYTDGAIYEVTFRQARVHLGGGSTSSIVPDRTQWHSIAIVSSPGAGNWKFYQNGEVLFSNTGDASITFPAAPNLGKGNNSVFYDGWMDEVRIYNRALTQEEIVRLHNLGTTTTKVNTVTAGGSLTDELVGHFTFDGNDMYQNVSDVSGQGNTGYLTSFTATTTTIGILGQALAFDGSDDYVNIPTLDNGTSYDADSVFSVSGWFKTTETSVSLISDWALTATGPPVSMQTLYGWAVRVDNTGVANFTACEGASSCSGDVDGTTAVNDGAWHHVVVVSDNTSDQTAIYVDGVQEGVTSHQTIASDSTRQFHLGNQSNTSNPEQYGGSLDDVRVYSRALTAQEVQRLYSLGR